MPQNPIKLAIRNNRIERLKNFNINELISYCDKSNNLNAFLFSCANNCKTKTTKLILDRTLEYFANKIQDSEDYKNLNIGDDEKIDIAKCGPAGQEFYAFFYGTFKSNGMELNAAALAHNNKNDDTVDLILDKLLLAPVHDKFLPLKKQREEVFNNITKKHGQSKSAYFSSDLSVQNRHPRQFHKERERQLLKQLSTILFFYIKANGSEKLTEIESLHLRIGDVSHLIISCNGGDDLGKSFEEVLTMENLHQKLQADIQIVRDIEGRNRTARYQSIFKKIFNNSSEENQDIGYNYSENNGEKEGDIQSYRNIIEILQDKKISIHCINNYTKKYKNKDMDKYIEEILKAEKPSIIILNNKDAGKEKGLHAEEYLIDFSELIAFHNKKLKLNKTLYGCIAGKKRPCFTCYTTMLNFKKFKKFDNFTYGGRPGYAWKSALHLQEKNNPNSSKVSLLTIFSNNSHVTLTKDNKSKSDYDSGSDDEEIKNEEKAYLL